MLTAIAFRLDTGAISTALRGLALAAIVVCSFVIVATVAPLALAVVATWLAVVGHAAGIVAAMVAHAATVALALVVRVVVLYAAVKLISAARHVNWQAVGAVVKPLVIAVAFVALMVFVFAWAPVVWAGCCSLAATVAGVAYNVSVIAGTFAVALASVKLM